MDKVISVIMNKLAKKDIERLPLAGSLTLCLLCKKSEILETKFL